MSVKDTIRETLESLGIPKDEAAEIADAGEKATKAVQDQDSAQHGRKEGEEAEAITEAPESPEAADTESEAEADGEDVPDDELALFAADLAVQLTERNEEVKELQEAVKALAAGQQAILEGLKAMQTEKQKEQSFLPKAVYEALQAQKGETVPGEDVVADMRKQQAALEKETEGKVDFESDPFGWLGKQANIPGL